LWCLLITAYGTFWFSVGTLVSVYSKRSGTSALAVLGCWLLFVVVIPSGYDVAVGWAHPLPSHAEHLAARRARTRQAEERGDKLLEGYLHDHPELSASGADDAMMRFMPRYLAVTEAVERELAPLSVAFERARDAQRRLAHRLRFLSPSLVLQSALCDLAGTGPERHALFHKSTRKFQAEWRSFFLPRAFQARRLTSSDFDRIPEFHMAEEPTGAVVGRVAPGLAVLLALTGLLGLLAATRAKRLSPAETR
jgi:ABC-2 type transport system permease protein